ncbi:DUF1232 domain-containing protein [Sphingobacterium shayense]|uniref:YkvA family protein n=1 Tax=Sphingobacterium shayense TaxID=626343 RepID=UPI0015543E86|nr:DUF1232 domain-containing protein [Sphingobacterium shayense]NQD70684.1 DUF1232 domain-containing protein [Sphingobacterium shayense]
MRKINTQRMFRLFTQLGSKNITGEDLDRADDKVSFLEDRAEDFKVLIAMCRDSLAGRYTINKWSLSIVVGTILYVISPLDAIPDLVPILGWMDDVTIVGYAIKRLSSEITKYKDYKKSSTISPNKD